MCIRDRAQRVAVILVFGEIRGVFLCPNLDFGAIQPTLTGFGKLNLNRRRQQVVARLRLRLGQPVSPRIQLRKALGRGHLTAAVDVYKRQPPG